MLQIQNFAKTQIGKFIWVFNFELFAEKFFLRLAVERKQAGKGCNELFLVSRQLLRLFSRTTSGVQIEMDLNTNKMWKHHILSIPANLTFSTKIVQQIKYFSDVYFAEENCFGAPQKLNFSAWELFLLVLLSQIIQDFLYF